MKTNGEENWKIAWLFGIFQWLDLLPQGINMTPLGGGEGGFNWILAPS